MHGLLAGGNGLALLTQHTQRAICWTAWLASHHLTCAMHLSRLTWGHRPAVPSRYVQLSSPLVGYILLFPGLPSLYVVFYAVF